jgi:hypothetical protein
VEHFLFLWNIFLQSVNGYFHITIINKQKDMMQLQYRNGSFYHPQTGARVAIADGTEVMVKIPDGVDLLPAPPAGTWPLLLLEPEQQLEVLQASKAHPRFKKILNRGSEVYFTIARKEGNAKTSRYTFEVKLLEDLYFYGKENSPAPERIYPCACAVINNVNSNLPFFEEVYAQSLNELYKNTYVHFFGNSGHATCNVFDRFYTDPADEQTTIHKLRYW